MSKLNVTVSCPADTYSGYGARSRDFVRALIQKYPDWNIEILTQRWGNTRFGFLEDHGMDDLASRLVYKLTKQPDVFFQITVPNEFQKVGKYNIGVTAAIETTVVDASWIEGCNRMDLIIASSNHSKDVLTQTSYDRTDKRTGARLVPLKCSAPVEVLFEGVDLNTYFRIDKYIPDTYIEESIDTILESQLLLFVGHWIQGDVGQDRKNVGLLVKKFLEAYKNKKNPPALLLKTQQATSSIMDRSRIINRINNIKNGIGGNLPNIYLLHGDVNDQDMNRLYNHPKVKGMISLTKGEGFGRPLLEFSITGKPIIASGWSGHVDFLDPKLTSLITGKLEQVHPSAVVDKMILKESQWFAPNEDSAVRAIKDLFKNYKKYLVSGKKQGYKSRTNFSFDNMSELLKIYLDKYVPEFPEEVQLQLPKLNLPKLKKIEK